MEIIKSDFDTRQDKANLSIALGLFDSVHIAHQKIIKTAKEKSEKLGLSCAVLTFSLDCDSQIRPLKKLNDKMILSDENRLQKFEELGADFTFIPQFTSIKNLSPEDFFYEFLIKQCNVKAITCGYDYKFGSGGLGTTDLLKQLCIDSNIDLTIIEQQKLQGDTISSTLIRKLLETGDIAKANELLGYNYTTCYEIVKGNQIGRQIGFNTANQVLDQTLTIPCYGVYKTTTTIGDTKYSSITSIGIKPTFEGDKTPLSETHIFDFDRDIYGQSISVEYVSFIRPERKFDSITELQSQIQKDVDIAKS